MLPLWLTNGIHSLDFETTGPDPTTARIVSATLVEVGPQGVVAHREWLVNPGVEIPAEATAVHGITNERVQAEGVEPRAAVEDVASALAIAFKRGQAVCIFNAAYDLTVLHAEARRHRAALAVIGPIVDPMVIDRAMSKRSGKRTLEACAEFYGVKMEGAHTSIGDALCAARVLWKQAKQFSEVASQSLNELQTWQEVKHRQDVERFREWLQDEERRLAHELERRRAQFASTDVDWPMKRELQTR